MAPFLKYNPVRNSKKYRWITKNGAFNQSWDTGNLIKYRRDDVRITLDVDGGKIIPWVKYCAGYENHPWIRALNHHSFDYQNWYLHEGDILIEQFKEIIFRNGR